MKNNLVKFLVSGENVICYGIFSLGVEFLRNYKKTFLGKFLSCGEKLY